ncbi:hypothetical protein PG984_002956 [Apiospora sp. TS-2023a]
MDGRDFTKFKTSTVLAHKTSAPGQTSTSSTNKSGDPAPTCAPPSGENNALGVKLWAQWGSTLGLWGVLPPVAPVSSCQCRCSW